MYAFMYVCMYDRMYVCMYVCMYVYLYTPYKSLCLAIILIDMFACDINQICVGDFVV